MRFIKLRNLITGNLAGKGSWLLLLFALLPSCSLFDTILSPVDNVIRRGSCISVDIPPITLTPARTAAERQLIGEDREIEKNGWLIASSPAGSRGETKENGEAGATEGARNFYRELSVLEFYDEYIRDYKQAGLLGEGRRGDLVRLPPSLAHGRGRYANPAEIENAMKIAGEVNRSRKRIKDLVNSLRKEGIDTAKDLAPFLALRPGEWFQNDSGEWIRLR